jgi:arsenate reductase-like glutaredoxin family protein
MPDFDGARAWIGKLRINEDDRGRLLSWVAKMSHAYDELDEKNDDLLRDLGNAHGQETSHALVDAIRDHERGLLDTAELYALADSLMLRSES